MQSQPTIRTFLLRRSLALLVALVSVVTLPVCHPELLGPHLDGDARTVTEATSVVETFSTPGTRVLHQPAGQPRACAACERQELDHAGGADDHHLLAEFTARVALASDAAQDEAPDATAVHPMARLIVPAGIAPYPETPPPIPAIA